jgi:hypothetical protein
MQESKPNPQSPESGVVVAEPGKLDVEPQTEETKAETAAPAKEPKAQGDSDTESGSETQQQVKRLERQLRNMGPYAQFGLAVAQDQKGQGVIQRWQKGEALFDQEEAVMGEEKPQSQPLTEEGINRLLDTRETARRQMDTLNEMASENLEHFPKIRKSQKFVKALNGALATVWNDPDWHDDAPEQVRGWDDEGAAKNYTALTQAYRYVLANNPKVLEAAKEAGKREAKEKAEAAMAASVSSGGTSSSQEEPPPKSDEQKIIDAMVNASDGRKSFRTVARKR